MVSKIFRWNLVLRLTLILIVGYAALYILLNTPFWMVSVWMFLAMAGLTVGLVRYAEKNYRSLGDFLMAIDQNDFSYLGNIRKLKKDSRLGAAFNHIADLIERLRLDAQSSFQYLQTVVNHVDVGIVCYDEQGKISLFNKAARNLLGISHLNPIRYLYHLDPEFHHLILNIKPGERKLYQLKREGKLYQLSVLATRFIKESVTFKLVSFQNIEGELEQKEMESWYRLTRVLTHEIMNSAIPISNLSGMVYETLVQDNGRLQNLDRLEDEEEQELKMSLQTIQSRSNGLVKFVHATRQITRLPDPELEMIDAVSLVRRVLSLFAQKLRDLNIQYHLNAPDQKVQVKADPGQMEQVLINLLQNAIDAVEGRGQPAIFFHVAYTADKHAEIRVADNGAGIPQDVRENLFVPFYTTKKKGSGIGLSLSRHIIHNHKGKIEVKSREGAGSEFIIHL